MGNQAKRLRVLLSLLALLLLSHGLSNIPTNSTISSIQTAYAAQDGTDVSTSQVTSGVCGRFQDSNPGDFYYDGAQFMGCRQVLGGYACGTYNPQNNSYLQCYSPDNLPYFLPSNYITRGQLAKIVTLSHYLCNPCYNPSYGDFDDVPPNSTFYQYVEAAVQQGLMEGTGYRIFNPDGYATRAQAAKASVVAAGYTLVNPSVQTFSDVYYGTQYYQYIETANARGLAGGYSDGTFRPTNSLTRGQYVKIDTSARFYHSDEPDRDLSLEGLYPGSNNVDVAIPGYQPDLRTLPSGELDASLLAHNTIRGYARKILYTAAAKQWLLANSGPVGSMGREYQPGLEFFVNKVPFNGLNYCPNGNWYYASTNLPGSVLENGPSIAGCERTWRIPYPENYPDISTNNPIYWADGQWSQYDLSVSRMKFANIQWESFYQFFARYDMQGDFCFDQGSIKRCP